MLRFGDEVILDDFNRADGALGANWTTPVEAADAAGTPAIFSNVVSGTNGVWDGAYWNPKTFGPDTDVYFSVPAAATLFDACKIYARAQNIGTGTFCCYYASCSSTAGVRIGRYYNNSNPGFLATISFNVPQGPNNGRVGFRVITAGPNIRIEVYGDSGAGAGFVYRGQWIDVGAVAAFPLLANAGNVGFAVFALGPADARETIDNFGACTYLAPKPLNIVLPPTSRVPVRTGPDYALPPNRPRRRVAV